MIDRQLYKKAKWSDYDIDALEAAVLSEWSERRALDRRASFRVITGGKSDETTS